MPTPKKAAAPKNALSKPVQPDAALAAVVGKDPLPRTELTKKLWEYVRKHELQDPKDKRSIRADEKLLAVFDGKKVVSMFEMTKYSRSELRDVFPSGCGSQPFGGDLGQKSMEIVAGEGPVEGRCRPLIMGLKGKQALFEFLQR